MICELSGEMWSEDYGRREKCGSGRWFGLAENRNYPGFWHNIYSVFHRGLIMLPWFKDLELENVFVKCDR
jgi:hypothetical protein